MIEPPDESRAFEAGAGAPGDEAAFAAIRLRAQRRQRAIQLAIELGLAPQAAEAAIDRAMIDRLPDRDQVVQNQPLHLERLVDSDG